MEVSEDTAGCSESVMDIVARFDSKVDMVGWFEFEEDILDREYVWVGKGVVVWVSALVEVCGITDIWVFRRGRFVDGRVEDGERFG